MPASTLLLPFPGSVPMLRHLRWHDAMFLLPALFLVLFLVLLGGGDLWLADHLYALQGDHWALQSHWLTSTVLHEGGRRLSVLLGLLVLGLWIISLGNSGWQRWRRPLGTLLLSVLASTVLVSVLKFYSPLHCPWDLQRYGGTLADSAHWPGTGLASGRCFPSGHASAGYAWLALYFFFAAVKPAWRWPGLVAGLAAGAVFGLAQQLRGAHFLSHDLIAALLCWGVAAGMAHCLRDRQGEPA